jgi:CHAT domain-containing protein
MAAALDHLDDLLVHGDMRGADLRALSAELKQLALTDLRRAVDIADRLAAVRCDDGAVAVEVLSARAHVLCYANRFDDATDLLDQAARIAELDNNTAALAQVRLTSVQPLARAGQLPQAQRAAERARDAFARCGDDLGRAKSLLNLGIVQRMRGQPSEAMSTFDAALPLLTDQPMLLGALSSNRAEALLDLDRFGQAETAFVTARDAFHAAGNAHGAAIVEGNLADLLAREGRLNAALERFELARKHYEASGALADAARLEAESAEAMAMLGAHDAAILALGRCLPELDKAGLVREWRRGQFVLGSSLLAGGHTSPARSVVERLLERLGEEEPVLRAQCLTTLAATGPSDHAASLAHEGLALLKNRPARLAQAHAWLADAALRRGDLDDARSHLGALDANATATALAPLRAQRSHLQGRVLRAEGKPREAAQSLRDAMLEAERIRAALRAERWRVACGQHWRDVYLDTMSAAFDVSDLPGALDALERVRGRTLVESLGARIDRTEESAALRQHVDALNIYYARLDTDEDASSLAEKIAQTQDEIERLRAQADAADGTRQASGEPISMDTICDRLPDRGAIIEFFVEDGQVGVFVLRRDRVRVHRRLASNSEIERCMFKVRFAIDQDEGADDLWHAAVGALARALLDPIAQDIEGIGTLGIGCPANLEGVPWPALPLDGAPLIERLDVVMIPSATTAVTAREASAPGGLLAIGVRDDLAPDMEAEAATAALLSGGHAMVGGDAAAAGVLAAIGSAGVVHLATHCVFSTRHPMASRLKLADRWLGAHELASAVRSGARIVLAGCETGRAGGINTEDRTGLVNALLASGAAEVVSARWPLHDETARRTFESMYTTLASESAGITLARALCHAQRQMARLGAAPWRWAALQVTGGLV